MSLRLPKDFDAELWLERWEKMQERYNARRAERFSVIVELVGRTQGRPRRIVDLGCGTGSLMVPLLRAFGNAEVVGVDLDPVLMSLARHRLKPFGKRARLVRTDLRSDGWVAALHGKAQAVVSATALHWLSARNLSALYRRIAGILDEGGIFLNADHVAAECSAVQSFYEAERREFSSSAEVQETDDWDGFWREMSKAWGEDLLALRGTISNEVIEEGLPLSWHLRTLRAAGFSHAECYWRLWGDAVYGGFRRRLEGA
jgi:SAM-dependent methyltransferase